MKLTIRRDSDSKSQNDETFENVSRDTEEGDYPPDQKTHKPLITGAAKSLSVNSLLNSIPARIANSRREQKWRGGYFPVHSSPKFPRLSKKIALGIEVEGIMKGTGMQPAAAVAEGWCQGGSNDRYRSHGSVDGGNRERAGKEDASAFYCARLSPGQRSTRGLRSARGQPEAM